MERELQIRFDRQFWKGLKKQLLDSNGVKLSGIDANFKSVQIKASIFSQMLLHCFFLLFGMLVLRKTIHAINAVNYVRSNSYTMSPEAIGASPQFKELIFALESEYIKPPAFFLLNQHALNMTFNFLCSTERLGVHERFIFVTLDPVAKDVLMKHWPKIRQLYLPVPSLFVCPHIIQLNLNNNSFNLSISLMMSTSDAYVVQNHDVLL